MNSQRPSEPMMSVLVLLVSGTVYTSASEMTPAECATVSPRERLIASPGISMCLSQTRAGPSTPSSYSTANTRPPDLMIRAFSFGSSGLLSMDTSFATILPESSSSPSMMRESPQLAQYSVLSIVITVATAVVPENSVSIDPSLSTSASTVRNCLAKAALMPSPPDLYSGELNTAAAYLSLNCCDTRWPASPCPSNTDSINAPVASSSAMISRSWFFLRGLYGA
mmetsp:Transcript_19369/g.45154  ORF Transcript_19369/g.45154 Transcript_19369/m.45154 type:complete len:224 (-) Transcript_19369:256-927(-)